MTVAGTIASVRQSCGAVHVDAEAAAAGVPLRQVYLSHLAVEDDDAATFRLLMQAGLTLARRRRFELALVGLATDHPFAGVLRRQGAAEYRSLLHLVHWPEAAPADAAVAPGTPHPEIAVM